MMRRFLALLLGGLAMAASGVVHYVLFSGVVPVEKTVDEEPPKTKDEKKEEAEKAEKKTKKVIPAVVVLPTGKQPRRAAPDAVSPPPQPQPELPAPPANLLGQAGGVHDELGPQHVLRFDLGDVATTLAVAHLEKLTTVGVVRDKDLVFEVRTGANGACSMGPVIDARPLHIQSLPPADESGRRLRYADMLEQVRKTVPADLRSALVLGLCTNGSELVQDASAVIAAHCRQNGIPLASVRRSVVRPRLRDGKVGFDVVEINCADAGATEAENQPGSQTDRAASGH